MLFGKINGIGYTAILVFSLCIAAPVYSFPQDIHGDVFVFEDSTYSAVTESNGVEENLSFSFDEEPLQEVLRDVAYRSNLTLSYPSHLFQKEQLISAEGWDLEINSAMKRILDDTELEFEVTQTRHLVIFNDQNVGNITGRVVDAGTGKVMQDARVYLIDANNDARKSKSDVEKGTFVDSIGKFDINNVDVGSYHLIVIYQGYQRIIRKIEIKNNQTTEINFELHRNS